LTVDIVTKTLQIMRAGIARTTRIWPCFHSSIWPSSSHWGQPFSLWYMKKASFCCMLTRQFLQSYSAWHESMIVTKMNCGLFRPPCRNNKPA